LPTKDEHLDKALRNQQLADVLAQTAFSDWAVTVYFYAALHYAHAVLADYGQHPQSHETAGALVRKNPVLKKVWAEYKSLQIASRNARYYATEITPAHLQDVRNDFNVLKAYVRRELGLQ
jgi:uncharacterized protein (UPF0332 family)